MPGRREQGQASQQRQPKRDRHFEQVQPARHDHAAADDDGVGDHHRRSNWVPPEVERFGTTTAEQKEGTDESDVRGIQKVQSRGSGSHTSWPATPQQRSRRDTSGRRSSGRRMSCR